MTYRKRLHAAFLCCSALLFFAISPPNSFAQQETETTVEGVTLEKELTIDEDLIVGEIDEDSELLSRTVGKSEIADLEFLNEGVAPESIKQLKAMQAHVASLYERVEPAVVNIRSGMGQGSGVVVTSDGYILTAAHVISIPNRNAVITFPDGSMAKAQTLGLHRRLDAGLLRIYEMIPAEKNEEDSEEEDSEEEDSEEEDSEEEDSEEEGEEEEDSEEDGEEEEPGDDLDKETDSDEKQNEKEKTKPPAKRERFKVQDDLPSFNYLEIGDSDALNLGQWLIAVGHPGGLDKERGIVLRVGRVNDLASEILRTDCSLVGGDSGGPLIGMDGSVIGIHSKIGRLLRENFHVPSNVFLNNWTALVQPVVLDRDAELNVVLRGETTVIASIPGSSRARRSGLKVSDRIIRIGDKQVYDKLQFDDAISGLKPYQEVEFEVQRKGKNKVLNVVLGEKSVLKTYRQN